MSRIHRSDAMALHDSLILLVAIRSCPWVPESQNVMHCTLFSAVREFLFVRLQTKDCHHRMRRLPRAQPHPRCPRSELQHLGLGHVRRALGRSSHWTRSSRTRFIRTLFTMLLKCPTRGIRFCEACVSRAPQRRPGSPCPVWRATPLLSLLSCHDRYRHRCRYRHRYRDRYRCGPVSVPAPVPMPSQKPGSVFRNCKVPPLSLLL